MSENNNTHILQQIASAASAFLGYTLPNFALYFSGDVWVTNDLINCLNGKCPDDLQISFKLILENPIILGVCLASAFMLAFSNQKNYYQMNMQLFKKKSDLESMTKNETDERIKDFFSKIIDIMATHTKVRVTVGSLMRLMNLIIGNVYVSLGICAVLNMMFGEMSQFAVLGRNYNIDTFRVAFLSFIESFVATGVLYPVLRFGFQIPQPGLYTYVSFIGLQLAEAIVVAAEEQTLFGNLWQGLKSCVGKICPGTITPQSSSNCWQSFWSCCDGRQKDNYNLVTNDSDDTSCFGKC